MAFSPGRRRLLTSALALALVGGRPLGAADARETVAQGVLATWYRLAFQLVRHTPTMTPPVASRALAYLGIGAFEALASGDARLITLAGQLHDMPAMPARAAGQAHDTAVVLNAVLDPLVQAFFANTGPSGQRAMAALSRQLAEEAGAGVPGDVAAASRAHGGAVAEAVLGWSLGDGGAEIDNMGFPRDWTPGAGPGHWVPTSTVALQQAPLLPDWGRNRPFALPAADTVAIAEPEPYSEDPASPFWQHAKEVCDVVEHLTPEEAAIARFWSDDAMLSFTPPGHWTAILNQVAEERGLDLATHAEALARMGIAMADAFIACWAAKYRFDTIRPVTYIREHIDPDWQPLLNTPPFPEYPSGHSVQSAAAAALLTHLFGADYAFTDRSPAPEGLAERSFASFDAAAEEAAVSRIYGGIHFRPAVENGKAFGRGVAAHAIALKTRA